MDSAFGLSIPNTGPRASSLHHQRPDRWHLSFTRLFFSKTACISRGVLRVRVHTLQGSPAEAGLEVGEPELANRPTALTLPSPNRGTNIMF